MGAGDYKKWKESYKAYIDGLEKVDPKVRAEQRNKSYKAYIERLEQEDTDERHEKKYKWLFIAMCITMAHMAMMPIISYTALEVFVGIAIAAILYLYFRVKTKNLRMTTKYIARGHLVTEPEHRRAKSAVTAMFVAVVCVWFVANVNRLADFNEPREIRAKVVKKVRNDFLWYYLELKTEDYLKENIDARVSKKQYASIKPGSYVTVVIGEGAFLKVSPYIKAVRAISIEDKQ